MHDLSRFTLADMTRCGADLRHLGASSSSMEEVAGKIVRHFYEQLGDPTTARRACVLARFYKTHPFGELPPELQDFGRRLMPSVPITATTKCLTLLGTAGDQPEWNARRTSKGHQAIPLPSKAVVEQIPMIAQLVHQLGIEVSSLLQPKPEILSDLDQRTYNVFYVPVARDSPFIPAQRDFVVPCGVASVLGFGGVLPEGNLYAAILFVRVPIPVSTAEMFRTVALNVKMAILSFVGGSIFAE
ncbi:MAG: hypothetical protein ACREQJ_02625 [Candidatus Binatia bacterium]